NGGGPVLAVVPAVRHTRRDAKRKLIAGHSSGSRAAEAYEDLRTLLLLRMTARRGAKSLLVTSPTGDTHTAVSANVAVALARAGRQVILVLGDLRHPYGHELFGIEGEAGLADVLEGRGTLTEMIQQTDTRGLQILTAGTLTGDVATAFHTPLMHQVFRRLRMSADIVIIDAPAILAGADIATMVELADMILTVGDARRTTRAEVCAAAGQLRHVRSKVIGCVLDNGRRHTRVVTPPLSFVTGHDDHAESRSTGEDSDEPSWLRGSAGGPAGPAPGGPKHANGWDGAVATGKRR
ncbi:MAG: CpsD/CapB family tyrosine-protein kinase, partial [Jatrophihabitantaceae bacterium]